jgi:spore coat polysaccharide biosynthesis protein SpsF
MYERVVAAEYSGKIVIAVTKEENDDELVKHCKENNINCFRGDTKDVLDRHYKAAVKYKADVVVKIPSDCPLIDPSVIDKVILYYINNQDKFDFVSNLHPASYPDGNDVEAMSFNSLESAWKNADRSLEREHTTPYIWENPDKFRIGNVTWESGLDYSMTHRFTIDYQEDYEFINAVYNELYTVKKLFTLDDILHLLKEKPELNEINEKYAGVNWYRNHLDELKTVKSNQTKII